MTEQNEIVEVSSHEIEPINMGSLTAETSRNIVVLASTIATELAEIINKQSLYTNIRGRKHVHVEGWTTMGAMLGITPKERYVKIDENGDYEAYVDLIRNSDGQIVGGASSIVGSDESTWQDRDRYARRSMSVTRATGKAFRLGYSWIMKLAGYEPTPFEEMPVDGNFSEVSRPTAQSNKGGGSSPKHEFGPRPYSPDTLKEVLEYKAGGEYANYEASEIQRNLLGMLLSEFYQGDTDKRHTVQLWLLGSASTKEIPGGMVKTALDWLNPTKDSGGAYVLDATSRTELSAVHDAALKAEGQEDLPI